MGTTRLTFMTVGLLLQLLVFRTKEVLKNYTHVIVDEAHERDVDLDLLLLLLRRQMRKQRDAMMASLRPPDRDDVLKRDLRVAGGGEGLEIALRIYTPRAEATAPRPLFYEIHGGGFLFGDIEMMDPWCQALAAHAGVVVASSRRPWRRSNKAVQVMARFWGRRAGHAIRRRAHRGLTGAVVRTTRQR